MRLPRHLLPRLALRVALVAGAALLAAPARADDGSAPDASASPLSRLKPEEQAIIRAKIAGVDALPREKQEQIVRNVETLRLLDPAQRDVLRRRLEQARDARLGGQRLDERVRGFESLGERQKGLVLHQGLVLRGLGTLAWRDLPAELRDDPRVRPLERAFAVAFHRKFWSRAFKALDAAAALAYEPSANLLPEMRDRLTHVRAQAQGGDEKALGRLKEAVFLARAYEATRDLLPAAGVAPDGVGEERRLTALGERLRDLARPAYDEALAEFAAKWREKGPEAWAQAIADMARPPEPPALTGEQKRRYDALQVAFTLEGLGGVLGRNPAFAVHADALLRSALVEGLGMSADDFARLPPRGDGAAQERRSEALREWLEQHAPLPRELVRKVLMDAFAKRWGQGGWQGGRARGPDNRPGPPGRRGGPGPGAPGAPGETPKEPLPPK